jgi:hypothetical protein
MRRTALLIGSQTHGLTGVRNDVEMMADVLAGRGYTAVRCVGEQATRAGILDAYERLICDARPDDAVVVYYSGHGGLAMAPPRHGARSPTLQFIVPTDYAGSAGSDFRGITSPELSVLLVRLVNATRNVTVIVDACHAAHLSRDDELSVKALYSPVYLDVAEQLDRLRQRGLDLGVLDVLGNQGAVRVVACGREQSAFEYTNADGHRIGLFTESLGRALTEVGDRSVSWAALLPRIRARVRAEVPWQRPEAEGPADRLLFRTVAAGLRPGPRRPPLGATTTIEWGRVVDGRAHPLPLTGAVVRAGERVYVGVRNGGRTTVHVSVLGFDDRSRLSVVTSLDPSGVPLGPGDDHVVGRDDLDGRLVGFAPAGRPGGATLAVVVASVPEPPVEAFRDLGPADDDESRHEARHDVHRIPFQILSVR